MRIIVTGGAGRLGRSVVTALAEAGHDVVSVDRDAASDIPARQLTADLTDIAATQRLLEREAPEAIVHLAAIAVPFSRPEPEILVTNATLATSVFSAAASAGIPRVLAASSPTVIGYGNPRGWQPAALPIDESHRVAPWNAYSLSKLLIEESVAMHARTSTGPVWGAFRPCYVITPDEWAGAPTQQGHTVAERLAHPEYAEASLFNYVDARDAGAFVRVWVESAAPELNGEVFFVGADDALTDGDVRDLLRPALPASAHALLADLQPSAALFSSAKAERLLGWRPQHHWRDELALHETRIR